MCRNDRFFATSIVATRSSCAVALALLASLGCASAPAVTRPHTVPAVPAGAVARAPVPAPNPKLPPVPAVDGPLTIRVVYPKENALIGSRDSNFVFGTVGSGQAGLTINGTLVPVWPNGAFLGWVPNPPADAQYYDLVARTSSDSARLRYPVRTRAAHPSIAVPPTLTPISPAERFVTWNDSLMRAVSDTDQIIFGRPTPSGTYRWFLFPGTEVMATAKQDGMLRVRLDSAQEAWISRSDLRPADAQPGPHATPSAQAEMPAPATLRINRPLSVDVNKEWVDLRIPVDAAPAYLVEEQDRGLTLTLYNTSGSAAITAPPHISDADVLNIRPDVTPSRVTIRVDLARAPYGYLTLYRDGVMTLRIRRPPKVDPRQPLRGLTIAVDPGHPPVGATGPTGLYEPVATLAVGVKVREILQAKGAHVIMTRTTPAPVALGDRPIIARRNNVNALVSIHLNAFPDGINPFRATGTGTYYFHPHSQLLATLMQRSLVPELGLRDLGIFRENLALARPTWMPAVLAEGLFIIMPDQEAAIRTPEYQEAYARGIVAGLEQFFATFAQ